MRFFPYKTCLSKHFLKIFCMMLDRYEMLQMTYLIGVLAIQSLVLGPKNTPSSMWPKNTKINIFMNFLCLK